jgi:HlyD family secretion protein
MIFPKKILAGVLALLVVAAAAYFLFFNKKGKTPTAKPGEETAEPAAKAEASALPVKVVPVKRGDLVMRLESPGEAYTERNIVLKTEVTGTIKNLNAKEGKHVRAGEVLVEIDDQEYRLKWERSEALRLRYLSDLLLDKQFAPPSKEMDAASAERIRKADKISPTASLYGQGMISREEFEKAKRSHESLLIESGVKQEEVMAAVKGLTQAEIDARIAQLELDRTKIRAPFAGIISDIKVSPQENISAGRELFTLVDINKIKVQARVLESEIGKMKVARADAGSVLIREDFKGHVGSKPDNRLRTGLTRFTSHGKPAGRDQTGDARGRDRGRYLGPASRPRKPCRRGTETRLRRRGRPGQVALH